MSTKAHVRAGCYCRISSDPHDKRAGVDRQREDTATLCEARGWTPVGFYVDNDRSASNGKHRPEWDRLLTDIAADKIDAIAAWDQDRNWRMMSELEALRSFFAKIGRQPLMATTGQGEIDLYSPTGVLTAQIKTAVSEHEIEMMRTRQRRAARQRAERGLPKWRKAFGYLPETRAAKDDDGTRKIDPRTAPLVRQAYRMLLAGASLNDICRMLNDAGAYGLNGRPWTATTVSLFLRSPRNAGLRSHTRFDKHGRVIGTDIVGRGTWPALIDETTWRAAQNKLAEPERRPGKKTVRRHLLTGLLRCGACGHHLSGMQTVTKTIAYRCKSCLKVGVAAHHIEPLLYEIVGRRLAREDAADLLRAEVHDTEQAEAVRTELHTLRTRLGEIADERAEGLIDGSGYRRMTDRINTRIAELERRQQDQERLLVLDGIPLGAKEAVDAVKTLSADRYRAIIELLMTVTVQPVGKGHRRNGQRFDPERLLIEWKTS